MTEFLSPSDSLTWPICSNCSAPFIPHAGEFSAVGFALSPHALRAIGGARRWWEDGYAYPPDECHSCHAVTAWRAGAIDEPYDYLFTNEPEALEAQAPPVISRTGGTDSVHSDGAEIVGPARWEDSFRCHELEGGGGNLFLPTIIGRIQQIAIWSSNDTVWGYAHPNATFDAELLTESGEDFLA